MLFNLCPEIYLFFRCVHCVPLNDNLLHDDKGHNRVFRKLTKLAIMAILASEALLCKKSSGKMLSPVGILKRIDRA